MTELLAANPSAIRDYFETHYLTIAVVAAKSGVTSNRVKELEKTGCIPGHTHEWCEDIVVKGVFGEFRFPDTAVFYYHPSVVDWIRKTAAIAEDMPLVDLAAAMRDRFAADLLDTIGNREPPWPDPVNYAWAYVLDGTWGACLKDICPESMLTKEYARKAIRDLRATNRTPTKAQRMEMMRHIEGYQRVAMPFAPHEVPTCSRTQEILPAVRD